MVDRRAGPKRRAGQTRQLILAELAARSAERGYAPSFDELGAAVGIGKSTVAYHIAGLAADGLIVRERNRRRAIKVVETGGGR